MNVLLTGGTGYIGSHTAVTLIQAGHNVVIADNLSNSDESTVTNIERITGTRPIFYKIDVTKQEEVESIFATNSIDAVIHFAGLKAVGESHTDPLSYYRTNLDSTLALLAVMQRYNISKIVFSSSATVYGPTAAVPYTETQLAGQQLSSPYAHTKFFIETILQDCAVADSNLEVSILRYFNPIGAHPSGYIGEKPNGTPNNLMPYLLQVASRQRDALRVFGDDYETRDGSGVRDYIHVVDVANGHLAALDNLSRGCVSYNLGSGVGTSVLELIKAFEKTTGVSIPFEIVARRAGDLAEFYADPTKARDELGWSTSLSIEDACRDAWKSQQVMLQK